MCVCACPFAFRLHAEAIVHYQVCCCKDSGYSESQHSTTHTSVPLFSCSAEPQIHLLWFHLHSAERLSMKYRICFCSSCHEYSNIKKYCLKCISPYPKIADKIRIKFSSITSCRYLLVLGLKAVTINSKSKASWVLYVLPILSFTVQKITGKHIHSSA